MELATRQIIDLHKIDLRLQEIEEHKGDLPVIIKEQQDDISLFNNKVSDYSTEINDLNKLKSDYNVSIEMFFQRESLVGTGFYPEIGDIVDWNNHYFEINHTAEPQLIQGNPSYNHMIIGRAHRISLSNLQIEERPR